MRHLILLFLILNGHIGYGQICNGSLGENIFEDGDFGSGASTIISSDPGLAPGYQYTTNVPIFDGYYQITNNSIGSFGTWLIIGDNSSDPDGYFMMVNASFTPGVFYEKVVDGLCPNTFYEFSADIINMIMTGVPNHILPNVEFLLDDEVQYSTGDIGQTEQWNTYGFTFFTGDNQTSIKLTLRNNAPGGSGNDLGLDNISFRPCGPQSFIGIDSDTTIFLCEEGDPFNIMADIMGADGQVYSIQWQRSIDEGMTWENIGELNNDVYIHDIFFPGNYKYRYLSASDNNNLLNAKCRIISDIIDITVLPKTNMVRDSFCSGSSYDFGDRMLDIPGSYIDTFISSLNCDSIVFLDLVMLDDPEIEININAIDPACFQSTDGEINIENIKNGYPPFDIFLNDEPGFQDNRNLPGGMYNVFIEDRYGCNAGKEIVLTNPQRFVIELPDDMSIFLGDEIMVNTESNFPVVTADWNNTAGFNCTDCIDPMILPFQDSRYVLTAINPNGCVAKDSFFVTVERQELFYLPNIFTPNEDGVNDVFYISTYRQSIMEIEQFSILDKWGNIVYEMFSFTPNDLNVRWSPGRNVADGVYSYIIKAILIDQSVLTITGDVTLIR